MRLRPRGLFVPAVIPSTHTRARRSQRRKCAHVHARVRVLISTCLRVLRVLRACVCACVQVHVCECALFYVRVRV